VCGNCLDDDRNGQTDYDDPSCCAATGAARLRKAQLRGSPSGGRLDLETTVSGGGFPTVNPTAEDLYIRLSDASDVTLLCGRIPATAFRKRKKFFQFLDRRNVVPGDAGVDGVVVKPLRSSQTLQVAAHGKRAELAATAAGTIRVTLAFDAAGPGRGRCASVVQLFRAAGRNKGLRFP
jgi:hypothetical protein